MPWTLIGTRKVSDIKNYTPKCMICERVIRNTVYDFREDASPGTQGQEIEVGPECAKRLLSGKEATWR